MRWQRLLYFYFLITLFQTFSGSLSSAQAQATRSSSLNNNKSLILKIRHSLSAQSSATTSGNTKLKTEANVNLAPGSTIESQIGSEDGVSTIEFASQDDSGQLSATGVASQSSFVFDDSTSMTSEIETLDESSGEGGSANASSNLVQESTLEVTYQDAETLSTFQQAF